MSMDLDFDHYLVGGAVRDEMLGLPVVERDWVVVGSTPEVMKARGFRQVGASFPVFLHPETNEEYALARTERKQGHGYHGFDVDFRPGVTLSEDLSRRDLTINAMAKDADGNLVDPCGGEADLADRWLRHVSPAFAEDPLRVLRVARFAARFAPLGFRVHPDTLELMRNLVGSGEVDHLVPERSWSEISRAMSATRPSVFVATLRECGALEVLLPEVDALYGVPQQAKYHPEIDAGIHLEMALDQAAERGARMEAVFAVLLHDLGKGVTPETELPAHRDHEQQGVPLVEAVCDRLRTPNPVKSLAVNVCRHHLNCHRALEMRPGRVLALLESLDALRQPEGLEPFVQACEADWCGREGRTNDDYPQADRLRSALAAALAVRARDLDLKGASGPEVGERLRVARIEAIKQVTGKQVTGDR